MQKLRVRNFVAQAKLFASGGVYAPDFIPPRRGAVLMWGEEEIREFAMLIVRYNIINGI